MKKPKLKDLENLTENLEEKFAVQQQKFEDFATSLPINIFGKVFYGKTDVSKKDASYTSTLWYVFCYLPFLPIDTFRIVNPAEVQRTFLPKVFALDQYINYETRKLPLNYTQVIITLFEIWTPIVFTILFLIAFPAYTASLLMLAVAGVLIYTMVKNRKKPAPIKGDTNKQAAKAETTRPEVPKKTEAPHVPIPASIPSSPKKLLATFQTMFSPAETPKPQIFSKGRSKSKPLAAVPMTTSHVPHLWDDLFEIRSHKITETTAKPSPLPQRSHLLEAIGYINFMFLPLYFFLYAYVSTVVVMDSTAKFLNNLYNDLTNFHLLAIVTAIVGIVVFLKNHTLGFFLLLFAALLFMNLHINLWNYINTL